ncbi:MAG: HD domain-containing protein [Treponema sp.]|jgi:putative two-component system response regulator|nr:HD domain-containing protein [Treponema sp.]
MLSIRAKVRLAIFAIVIVITLTSLGLSMLLSQNRLPETVNGGLVLIAGIPEKLIANEIDLIKERAWVTADMVNNAAPGELTAVLNWVPVGKDRILVAGIPGMLFYEVIKKLKAGPKTADIPVIFLSAHIDPGHELVGLGLGAVDYIYKPFSPILLMRRIENHMFIASRQKELKKNNDDLQMTAPERTGRVVELQNSILNTIAEMVEFPNGETNGHIVRIKKYPRLFVEHLIAEKIYAGEIAGWNLAFLVPASQLHDIGKIRIDNSFLNKKGKYTQEEFELVKNHADWGAKIIEAIEKETKGHSFLYHAKIFAVSHHEKWDGTGYPLGLKGEAIPLQGRLMAIADVYDALISKLPYKDSLPPEEAKQIILSEKGFHFDPLLTDMFENLSGEFAEIAKNDC